jgi:integrase
MSRPGSRPDPCGIGADRQAAAHHYPPLVRLAGVGQIVPANPAAAVRSPQHIVRSGKTPVLEPAEARVLLNSIDATTLVGLRDRALIAFMVYSFARVGAALAMKVEDVFVQNRRLWVWLREKGGKAHAIPCHRNLE